MTKDIIIVIGILKTPVAVFLLQPSSLQKHIVRPFYKESETIIRVNDWIKKSKTCTYFRFATHSSNVSNKCFYNKIIFVHTWTFKYICGLEKINKQQYI